eukprot:31076-Pelagococcus_subviridis.AAC.3
MPRARRFPTLTRAFGSASSQRSGKALRSESLFDGLRTLILSANQIGQSQTTNKISRDWTPSVAYGAQSARVRKRVVRGATFGNFDPEAGKGVARRRQSGGLSARGRRATRQSATRARAPAAGMRRARPRSRRLWHLAGALLAISLAVASVATPRGGTRAAGDARARRRDSERGGKESGETERTPPPRGEVVARARAASSRTPPLSRPRRRKDYERRRLDAAVDPAFGAGGEEAGAGGETCAGACGLCRASCCCDGDCVALGDCCGDFSDDGVCEAQKEGNLGGGGDDVGEPPPPPPGEGV